MMWNMLIPKPVPSSALETMEIITPENIPCPANDDRDVSRIHESFAPAVTYLSGESDEDDIDDDQSDLSDGINNQCAATPRGNRLPVAPPLKQRRLDIPYCTQRKLKQDEQMLKWGEALVTIDKLLASKKTKFISGPQGLQACCTLAIQSHLQIVVKSQRYSIDASERAAESHGFAAKHGGWLLRSWTRHWTKSRKLPIVRNTNRNWHTLGQGIETSGRSSVKRNIHPIIWPYMPIAKYPVPGPTHKVSGENL